jgi:biopolymer transport protein ExbD
MMWSQPRARPVRPALRPTLGPGPLELLPLLFLTVLLLLIVLVLSPLGIDHHRWVPVAVHGTPIEHRQTVLGIDRDGRFWLPNTPDPGPIRRSDLAARLDQTISAYGGAPRLSLEASPRTPYSFILDVVDVARELGIDRLDLLVDCPAGSESLLASCAP